MRVRQWPNLFLNFENRGGWGRWGFGGCLLGVHFSPLVGAGCLRLRPALVLVASRAASRAKRMPLYILA